jgi:hypothetical protein
VRRLLSLLEATAYVASVETAGDHVAFDVRWSPYRSLRREGAIDVTCQAGCVHTVHHDEVRKWLANPPEPRKRLHGVDSPLAVLRSQLVEFARGLAAEQWNSCGYYCSSEPEHLAMDAVDRARAETKADIGRALLTALGEE